MSAGDVTSEMITTWIEIAVAPREVGGIPEILPILEVLEASRAEVAALRSQMEKRESPDWVTVRETWWTVAQILANAWRRHPLTCGERDKLVAEWDALRSGEAGKEDAEQWGKS